MSKTLLSSKKISRIRTPPPTDNGRTAISLQACGKERPQDHCSFFVVWGKHRWEQSLGALKVIALEMAKFND